jgi:hypothetical protein
VGEVLLALLRRLGHGDAQRYWSTGQEMSVGLGAASSGMISPDQAGRAGMRRTERKAGRYSWGRQKRKRDLT